MNISFFDGVNDGKFYSINAGKYDEFSEEDIDISTEVEEDEEDDADTCLNRFAALEKDASKLHMDFNNLRNEFKGSCKDWNDLSDTVDHMLNNIAELKTIMNRADDRLNKRLNVISEANVVLTDKLNLVEKKLEVFKCIDILDRVTKLEEQIKPTNLEEAKDLEVRPSVLDDILDRVTKLEGRYNTCDKLIRYCGGHITDTDCKLSGLSDRVSKLDSKFAVMDKHVRTINSTIGGYGRDYFIIADRINELESKLKKLEEDSVSAQQSIASVVTKDIRDDVRLHSINNKLKGLKRKINEELDWKDLTDTAAFESGKNDIQSDAVNHPKHYTDGKYECIDFIEEYGMVTHIGNAIKYVTRAGIKDKRKYAEDLNKAFWYLHRYNTPRRMTHIDPFDYAHDKMLTDDLVAVISAIVCEDYKEAEKLLGDYIVKITGKPPKALEDEQSK